MNKVIIAVFKTIAIFIIASVFISMGMSTFMLFTTQSKLQNVAIMMQNELSRNNRLLGGATAGTAAIDGYAEQLYNICASTEAQGTTPDGTGHRPQLAVLESIVIREAGSGGGTFVTYTYDPTTKSCNTVYTYGATGDEPTDRADKVGKYGDVKTIEINYRTFFYNVISTNAGRGIGVDALDAASGGTPQQIKVYAPCLRYIKEG